MNERLNGFTSAELAAELKAREGPAPALPIAAASPDFTRLTKCITDGLADMVEKSYEDEDLKSYIYEEAVEAVYGKGFWSWRRAQKW